MTVEEIVYEAYSLGLREKVFVEVSKIRENEKYKHTPLIDIYEKAFKEVKKK